MTWVLPGSCKRVFAAVAITVAITSVALVLLRPAWLPLNSALVAALSIWIGLAPGLAHCLNPQRPGIPFLPLTGLFYVIFFALPVFFANPDWWTSAGEDPGVEFGIIFHEYNILAIAMVAAGTSLMFGAFVLTARIKCIPVPHFSLPRAQNSSRTRLLLWPLLLGHLTYLIVPSLGQIASIGQLLGPAGYLAFGMFYLLWMQGQLSRYEIVTVFFVFLPAALIYLFASGLLTKLAYFGIFMSVLMVYAKRWRQALILAVFSALLVGAFYPAVSEYRSRTWESSDRAISIQAKSALFIDIMVEKWRNPYQHHHERLRSKVPLIRRISLIALFSLVVEKTPETVPYIWGASYKPLPTSFVPRLIWPSKPEERLGQWFGHRYGILLPDDKGTSINVPWIVEMYANFGIWGVLIGMTVAGVLLGFLQAVFNRSEMSPLEIVIGTTIFLPLFYQEANFSLMTGSLVPLTIGLWLYFWVGLTIGNRAPNN